MGSDTPDTDCISEMARSALEDIGARGGCGVAKLLLMICRCCLAFPPQVIEMVLATDMKQHFALMSHFTTVHRLGVGTAANTGATPSLVSGAERRRWAGRGQAGGNRACGSAAWGGGGALCAGSLMLSYPRSLT